MWNCRWKHNLKLPRAGALRSNHLSNSGFKTSTPRLLSKRGWLNIWPSPNKLCRLLLWVETKPRVLLWQDALAATHTAQRLPLTCITVRWHHQIIHANSNQAHRVWMPLLQGMHHMQCNRVSSAFLSSSKWIWDSKTWCCQCVFQFSAACAPRTSEGKSLLHVGKRLRKRK